MKRQYIHIYIQNNKARERGFSQGTCSTTYHNVQLISQLLNWILSYTVDVCAFFSAIIQFFLHNPECPDSYPRLGITALTTWCRMSSEDYCCWKVKQFLTQMQTWMIHYWIKKKKDTTEMYCKPTEPISHFDILCSKILLMPPPPPFLLIHSTGSFTGQEVELLLHKNTCFDWNN